MMTLHQINTYANGLFWDSPLESVAEDVSLELQQWIDAGRSPEEIVRTLDMSVTSALEENKDELAQVYQDVKADLLGTCYN